MSKKDTVVMRVYRSTRDKLRLSSAIEDKDMQDIAEEMASDYMKKKGHRK